MCTWGADAERLHDVQKSLQSPLREEKRNTWKMISEVAVTRTGQSEEDNLLVGELLGGVVVDGDTARGDLASLLSPGDVAIERN